ncbi:retrovirus-related pol polyprotein from transposon TNT 1-94 [Tanacetum coccineum]
MNTQKFANDFITWIQQNLQAQVISVLMTEARVLEQDINAYFKEEALNIRLPLSKNLNRTALSKNEPNSFAQHAILDQINHHIVHGKTEMGNVDKMKETGIMSHVGYSLIERISWFTTRETLIDWPCSSRTKCQIMSTLTRAPRQMLFTTDEDRFVTTGLEFLFSPLLENITIQHNVNAEDNKQMIKTELHRFKKLNLSSILYMVQEIGEPSSRNIDIPHVHSFHPTKRHDYRWTRDLIRQVSWNKHASSHRTTPCKESERLNVWELVDKPFGKMIIKLKWLWKNKKDEDQTVIRNKARLVAKGYAQEDAPRAWDDELSNFLISKGFTKGTIDPTLFKMKYGEDILLAQIYLLGDKLRKLMSMKQNCNCNVFSKAEYRGVYPQVDAQVKWISDADHAGYLDTRKSTSGGIQFLGDKLVENSIIELYFVRTEYQLADMFTKALPEDRFKYLVRRIGMRCLTPAELEVLTSDSA